MLELREVTKDNYYECCNMKREVHDFVGDAESVLAEAYVYRDVAAVYAIYLNNCVIGMFMADLYPSNGCCEFTNLFISDDYRNKGLGREVVATIVDFLKKKGAECIKVTVHRDNKRAIHLYQKIGFVVEKVSEWDENMFLMYLYDLTTIKKRNEWPA